MRRRFKSKQPITSSHKDKAPSHDDSDDTRNAKRVRFAGNGSSISAADVPKTSEYAYFKNVKNRSVKCSGEPRSNSSETQHYLNNSGYNNACDVRKLKNKDFEHSVSEERIRTSDHHTLVSPRVNLTFNMKQRSPLLSQHITPEGQHLPPVRLKETVKIPDSTCYTKQKSSVISQSLTPARGRQHFPSSTLNEAVDISGNQCSKKGIFSEKRQRLLQWVVRTSSPNGLDIYPNGSDLVAGLLNRLFPKSNESHGLSTEHSDNSKSLRVHKSKDLEKEPKVPHARNQDEHLAIIRYGNSNEIVPSEWNIFESHKFGSGNLIEYDTMNFDRLHSSESSSQRQLQFYHLKELDELCSPVEYARKEPRNRFLLGCNPERQKTGVYSSTVDRKSASLATSLHDDYQKMVDHEFDTSSIVNCYSGSLATSWHDDYQKMVHHEFDTSSIVNRNSASLATSWHDDYQKMVDHEFDTSSIVNRNSASLATSWHDDYQKMVDHEFDTSSIVNRNSASLATSWHDDYQKMVHHEFDTKSLCSSLKFNSLLNSESPNNMIQDFEPGLELVTCSVADPDQFALTFPYNPKSVSLEDYRNAENAVFSIDDKIACRDNHRFENKDGNGKLKDLWQKFVYASDISEEDTPSICQTWRFPCAEQYPFSADPVDHYIPSTNYHERHLDSLTNQTLLRSNFRQNRFEIDFYPDDDHNLEFGQVL